MTITIAAAARLTISSLVFFVTELVLGQSQAAAAAPDRVDRVDRAIQP
jgi:hypothetical protein